MVRVGPATFAAGLPIRSHPRCGKCYGAQRAGAWVPAGGGGIRGNHNAAPPAGTPSTAPGTEGRPQIRPERYQVVAAIGFGPALVTCVLQVRAAHRRRRRRPSGTEPAYLRRNTQEQQPRSQLYLRRTGTGIKVRLHSSRARTSDSTIAGRILPSLTGAVFMISRGQPGERTIDHGRPARM